MTNTIGKKIEELRKNAGIKQDELAEALGVTRQAVSKWELGLTIPKGDMLIAICSYFNVKPDYFLYENSDQSESTVEETALTADEKPEKTETIAPPPKKRSRKKTVLITCTLVIALLVAAIMLFIAWLEAPSEGVAVSVSASSWGFDIVTVLQIIASVILIAVVCFFVVLIIKHIKNRKK